MRHQQPHQDVSRYVINNLTKTYLTNFFVFQSALIVSNMNTTTNSNVCIVQPFGDRLELYIASSFSYGLGLFGSVILVRKILAEFSEANRNKRTIFSMFTAWIEFLVSSSLIEII